MSLPTQDSTRPSARQVPPVWQGDTRPVRLAKPVRPKPSRRGPVLGGLLLGVSLAVYLMAPLRTNVLLLGIDRAPQGTAVGRSDTMILATLIPTQPNLGLLSIPRDLWVTIPAYGANRINAAHAFGEAERAGSGPGLAMETVRSNFGVDVDYYARLQFDGLRRFVDALGGVEIELNEPTALLPAGRHTLSGDQALAFVRDRAGSDDFARMARSQLFLRSLLRQALRPSAWPRWPVALPVLLAAVDSDLPPWEWPRWAFALLRTGPEGIDGRSISREMVEPFVTGGGARVLAPVWDRINPVLMQMFGQ